MKLRGLVRDAIWVAAGFLIVTGGYLAYARYLETGVKQRRQRNTRLVGEEKLPDPMLMVP